MKHKNAFLLAVVALSFTLQAKATVIAIIDSGTDFSHPALVHKKWTNPIDIEDAVDNDDNGYIDDINGWNFADGNNKLVDKSFLGTFSPDTYKYFAVQTKLLRGTGTQADLDWIRAIQKDENFIGGLETFANFVHGTHVAGIASKNAAGAQVMALKIMSTKRPTVGGGKGAQAPSAPAACAANKKYPDFWIKLGLRLLSSQQGKPMVAWGKYVAREKARVANCSFGVSTAAAENVIRPLLRMISKCDPSDETVANYSAYFVQQVTNSQKVLVTNAPKTLFVIAAGNDGMNNDQFPSSPSNIKADNTISVAATLDYTKLATFSNYGKTMVEVAAPGVGIESSIPGNLYLTVSGTSQATPFVANVAGQILDQNPNLSNRDVKNILMSTVDLKSWLKDKVVSQGIVNPARAILAAKLSVSMGVNDAVTAARAQVNDVKVAVKHNKTDLVPDYEGYVMPLPTLFEDQPMPTIPGLPANL